MKNTSRVLRSVCLALFAWLLVCPYLLFADAPGSATKAQQDDTIASPVYGPENAKLSPLQAEMEKALQSIRKDPRPEEITKGRHYIVSNELRHYLLRERVQNVGGIHVGVGSEQNYILAGWSKPEILILMDFDQWIVHMHNAYSALFKAASTPEEFFKMWSKPQREESIKRIKSSFDNRMKAKSAAAVFQGSSPRIYVKFKQVRQIYGDAGVPIFLTDQDQFDHIKNLFETNRVLTVRGDLTAKKTMRDIAAFSTTSKIPMGTLYLSNAEYYFGFASGRYRQNILDQVFAENSVVIHTFPYQEHAYEYIFHTGENFQKWLQSRRVTTLRELKRKGEPREDPQLLEIVKEPPPRKGKRK